MPAVALDPHEALHPPEAASGPHRGAPGLRRYGRPMTGERRCGTSSRFGRRLVLAILSLSMALGLVPSASAAGAQSSEVTRLSRPGTQSYWAFVAQRVVARTRPDSSATAVGRLALRTEDGTDELVMVLERTRGADGRRWLRVRLPIRPVGSTGWIPSDALEPLVPVRTWLRIDTRQLRATLIRSGRTIFRARIGVGKAKWPTPRGDFYIRNKFVGFPPDTIYGSLAFGTSAKSEVLTDWPRGGIVGIHGTNRPALIPGRVSHGCIRMTNSDILRLGRLMPVGTPVSIR